MQLEHPSLRLEFPSSHSSLGARFPFPQNESQVEVVPEQLNPCSIYPVNEHPSPAI